MESGKLKSRTRQFGLDIIRLTEKLPRTRAADVLGRQLIRSGTSIGANYRAACRARSNNEFVAKLGIVEEEADESMYWLDLISDVGLADAEAVNKLMAQCEEILRMTVASIKTARRR